MKNDDEPVGYLLSRREALKLLGAVSAAMLVGCAPGQSGSEEATSTVAAASAEATAFVPVATGSAALPSCVVRPELTEGPYFVDERLNRSDIRPNTSDGLVSEGVLLSLVFNVSRIDANACTSFEGAMVDVWHCDALGVYSDVEDTAEGFDTVGQDFLRGYQLTDANGRAAFTTIYPGWYRGRAVHIHFKIRTDPDSNQGLEFTSQFFFDDNLTDQVHTQEPYASKGQRDLRNDGDNIYQSGGDQLLLTLTPDGDGYTTTFDIGLQVA